MEPIKYEQPDANNSFLSLHSGFNLVQHQKWQRSLVCSIWDCVGTNIIKWKMLFIDTPLNKNGYNKTLGPRPSGARGMAVYCKNNIYV
jgi:hypothetical protein